MASRSKFVRISSNDKIEGSAHNGSFQVELKETWLTQKVNKIYVHQALVPNAFYNIRSSQGELNNVLDFKESGQIAASISVDEGQYTLSELITEIETKMNANLVGSVLTITIDAKTKKLIFTFVGNSVIIYSTGSISPVIGLVDTSADSNSITMDYIPNLRGYDELYIHSRTFANSNMIDGDSGMIACVVSVPMNETPFGGIAYYQSSAEEENSIIYPDPIDISSTIIRLRDSKGNVLDPGTSDVVLILRCEFA
jgi:hypothetical protein